MVDRDCGGENGTAATPDHPGIASDIDATHAALQRVPDPDAVIDDECRYDGITLIDLLTRNERGQLLRRYADARTAICVRATELGMSTTQTARAIGMRSHTSVIGSRRR